MEDAVGRPAMLPGCLEIPTTDLLAAVHPTHPSAGALPSWPDTQASCCRRETTLASVAFRPSYHGTPVLELQRASHKAGVSLITHDIATVLTKPPTARPAK